ncbi:MAG: efflux RND transporter periplasmic adaptor subunit [Candidatus Aminicenantes bacterium]|nr:efflux RND transporter periplasmic adaptor subunit [Candidatus Aminicenantes bacterium]
MNEQDYSKKKKKALVIRTPRKSSGGKKRIFIIVAVILILAVIIFLNFQSQREKALKVTVEKIKKHDLTSIVSASGEVKPKKSVNISALISGRIVKIGVEEGQRVKKDDFLLKSESTQHEANADRDRAVIRTFRAELIKAEAQLKKDKRFYERQKKLHDEKLISGEQLEDAKTAQEISKASHDATLYQIRQAQASLESTLYMLSKTVYNSPIDGIITSLKVEEGEIAMIGTMNMPGTVLMTIADLSVMEVEVKVDETDVIGLSLGQKADVRIDALPDHVIQGKVTEIGSSALQKAVATEESKDFKVVITLESPPESLKPGLSASADIITAERQDILAIPISSLVLKEKENGEDKDKGEQEEGVYIIKDSRAKFQAVKKGIMGELMVEIISGLEDGQEIATGPYNALRQLKDDTLIKQEEKRQ